MRIETFVTSVVVCLLTTQILAANSICCPFCTASGPTISEQLKSSQFAVIAELTAKTNRITPQTKARFVVGDFKVANVLNDKAESKTPDQIEIRLRENLDIGSSVLLFGFLQTSGKSVKWTVPKLLDKRSREYIALIRKSPTKGKTRVEFFLDYLNDSNPIIADDALNEFSQASYADLNKIRHAIDRKRLLHWINDPHTLEHRLRLFYTLLGVCGNPDDARLLKSRIESKNPADRRGLDSLVACYLLLAKEEGLAFVDKALLQNKHTTQRELFGCAAALRFHGTEVNVIPKERLLKSIRLLLDQTSIADVVIPDLARLKDWTVADKLLNLFKSERAEHKFLRVSIGSYFLSFPPEKAKPYLETLNKIDADAVERARKWTNLDY